MPGGIASSQRSDPVRKRSALAVGRERQRALVGGIELGQDLGREELHLGENGRRSGGKEAGDGQQADQAAPRTGAHGEDRVRL